MNNVKESTRDDVLAAAERLGYHRRPGRGRPGQTDVEPRPSVQIVAGMTRRGISLFQSRLLATLEAGLSGCGRDCIVKGHDGEYASFLTLIEQVRTSHADDTLVLGDFTEEQLEGVLEAAPGALLVDSATPLRQDMPYESFGFDNVACAHVGVRHLLDCGCRRVLLVSGNEGHFFSRDIEWGWREALAQAGRGPDPALLLRADFSADGACAAVDAALAAGVEFDAVFTNDEMAAGVYRALLGNGRSIPGDVAVCGCDGLPVGLHLYPRLTTVALDYEELARRVVRHLRERERMPRVSCQVKVLPRLVVRESTPAGAQGTQGGES
jgi:LacI family transcriptional regulator